MTFYDALAAMKMGFAVRRRSWRSGAWRSQDDGALVMVRAAGRPTGDGRVRREVYVRVADFEADDWEIIHEQSSPAEIPAPEPAPAEW